MAAFVEILVRLPIALFGWGWIILVLAAIGLLATIPGTTRQARRIIVAICLLALAFGWQQVTRPLNFGVEYGHICTQKDDVEAFVRQKGLMGYWLVVRRDGEEQKIWLSRRARPKQVFWIQEGRTIGVEYRDQHLIVDIEALADPTLKGRILSPEEERRLDYHRTLNPEEEAVFEAARRAATEP